MRILPLLLLVSLIPLSASGAEASSNGPNVVFIIVDDLNDLPLHPEGKPIVPTPNMDRLASRGVSFTNAHTNDPICAPSRSSMMFGLYPQTSGLFWFENWRANGILNKSVSLTRHLRDNGYGVYGTGKVFHGGQDDQVYEEHGHRGDFGPWPWDGQSKGQSFLPHPDMQYLLDGDPVVPFQWEHHFGPLTNVPNWPADEAAGVPGYRGWRLFGKPWEIHDDGTRDPLADELSADWSAEIIAREHDKPFALFTGLIRTHTPLYAPKEYFDRFPLDEIELPDILEGDSEDCAGPLADASLYGFRRYKMLTRHTDRQLMKEWVQAYMACVSFVDDQVGTVLDAIEESDAADNTIVILTSDHGFHMGEKEFLYKLSLWDGATRIPLMVAGLEGMAEGAVCDQPVSLIDIYPTLNDLCGLPTDPNAEKSGYPLDGHSLKPLLMNPGSGNWAGPDVAISTIPGKDHMQLEDHAGTYFPHFSVRSRQWRYTLCANGEEELYDFRTDPLEWTNLADSPEHAQAKAALRAQLIELRDGTAWTPLDGPDAWKQSYRNFELEVELNAASAKAVRICYHTGDMPGREVAIPHTPTEARAGRVELKTVGWNRYRVRVLDGRCQVWINERLFSDTVDKPAIGSGLVRIDYPGPEESVGRIRQGRIRSLSLDTR